MTADVYLPRETKEFLSLDVAVNGEATDDFEVCVTRWPDRPVDWRPPDFVDGVAGVTLEDLTPGTWVIWTRVTRVQEAPVTRVGNVTVQ